MENNKELNSRLDALEQRGPRSNSKTERLRQVLDRIEGLLRKGFSQAEVLAVLNEAGFDMTLASFKSTLQRLRKGRANAKSQEPSMAETFRRVRLAKNTPKANE